MRAEVIPAGAWFRRAEGLRFHLRPCDLSTVDAYARRQGGDTRATLSRAEARLVGRLARWRRAADLGVDERVLVSLVERNCCFWSPPGERPARELLGEPLGDLSGPLALRGNVTPIPLLSTPGETRFSPFPQMPRAGELDGAELGAALLLVVEMDTEVASVVVACCPDHARRARDLWPRLDPDDPLVAALDDLGLLERHEAPVWDGRPAVTWLGHAMVLVEAAGRRLLVDPNSFHRSEPTRHAVAPPDPRDLGPLDAVLITHGDNDHLHPTALLRIDRRTPVVIPRAGEPRPYHVDMRRVLATLGFERVIEVDEWQELHFGDLQVIAAPFRGEDWGLELPCRTYLIDGGGLCVYLNADSVATPEAYDRLAAEHRIDVAFLGVTGAAESHVMPPGYGYGDFYAPWIPPEKHNQWIQLCNGPTEAAEAARRLRARFAFGYAAGGASFYPLAYVDRGTHAELAALLNASPDGPRPLDLRLGERRRVT